MNFDQIDRLLVDALPWLSVTVFPVLLILAVVFGLELHRLGDENVHDVDDYKPPAELDQDNERRTLRREPEPTPIHDQLAAEPMPDVVARRIANLWLEEIAADEQAKLGIRRPGTTCEQLSDEDEWPDARDMTGSFPVVAVTR